MMGTRKERAIKSASADSAVTPCGASVAMSMPIGAAMGSKSGCEITGLGERLAEPTVRHIFFRRKKAVCTRYLLYQEILNGINMLLRAGGQQKFTIIDCLSSRNVERHGGF